ncbi:uncharacterized protein LOC105439567 [Strongylocentrotus purpuratus]|uniref:Uncharacterized protein n=1 Tax=Strongylocentrotus purpuratus TaxID=7668 RepID=A0A7M7P256_STRPU|nr:uncharacterized protein LOC105439567 [Strongylocentrotus purpuratus]
MTSNICVSGRWVFRTDNSNIEGLECTTSESTPIPTTMNVPTTAIPVTSDPVTSQTAAVESTGLSDGAVAGIAVGGAVIVYLIFFLFVMSFFRVHQMMSYDRKLGRSISRLGPNRERERTGYRGEVFQLADYPSDMELGNMRKPGYSRGASTSGITYNEGFIRPYMAPSGNSRLVHDQYY